MIFKKMPLLAEGDGSFTILDATEGLNKKGIPMITLLVKLWDKEGLTALTNEWLTETNQWRARLILRATGRDIPHGNEDVEWNVHDFKGKQGLCEIAIEKSQNAEYPDKNKVKKYIEPTTFEDTAPKVDDNEFKDDVPF